jgi:hypothetical protein
MSNSKAIAKTRATAGAANIKVARPAASGALAQPQTAADQAIDIDGTQLYRVDPQSRIAMIRKGVPASIIGILSSRMGMSKESLLSSLGLSRATVSRKEKNAILLSKDGTWPSIFGSGTSIRATPFRKPCKAFRASEGKSSLTTRVICALRLDSFSAASAAASQSALVSSNNAFASVGTMQIANMSDISAANFLIVIPVWSTSDGRRPKISRCGRTKTMPTSGVHIFCGRVRRPRPGSNRTTHLRRRRLLRPVALSNLGATILPST